MSTALLWCGCGTGTGPVRTHCVLGCCGCGGRGVGGNGSSDVPVW